MRSISNGIIAFGVFICFMVFVLPVADLIFDWAGFIGFDNLRVMLLAILQLAPIFITGFSIIMIGVFFHILLDIRHLLRVINQELQDIKVEATALEFISGKRRKR